MDRVGSINKVVVVDDEKVQGLIASYAAPSDSWAVAAHCRRVLFTCQLLCQRSFFTKTMSNSLIFNSFQQNVDVLWEMLLVHSYEFPLLWCSVRDDIRLDLIASTSRRDLLWFTDP